ncbi:hypothetical protein [Caldivirga sp. MU80]|uniref:hypothetical protein n=1 Tax=Caldivirga sp. MU80 TaxID=1650354 RepID=UPI000AD2EECC|nr:hypothetical protein [Caldivirga sp. MU80]
MNADDGLSRLLVFIGILIPFLMSASCVFSVVYLFPQLAVVFHVGVDALSIMVTLSFIGGAVGGVSSAWLPMPMVDALGCCSQH